MLKSHLWNISPIGRFSETSNFRPVYVLHRSRTNLLFLSNHYSAVLGQNSAMYSSHGSDICQIQKFLYNYVSPCLKSLCANCVVYVLCVQKFRFIVYKIICDQNVKSYVYDKLYMLFLLSKNAISK